MDVHDNVLDIVSTVASGSTLPIISGAMAGEFVDLNGLCGSTLETKDKEGFVD